MENKQLTKNADKINVTYVFKFEQTHDEIAFDNYMQAHWADSFIYSAVYLIVIFGTQVYMQNRKRYELRPYLALWSGLLAVFSIIGSFRTLPEMVWSLKTQGFFYSCCNSSFIDQGNVSSFWTALFTLSKVLELGDTVFIVLRKQPLIFLHWYHHITVLWYCWFSYSEKIAPGRWFMVMNYVVHSFMYSYYCVRALQYQLPKWVNMFITTLQVIQMIMGIVVNIVAYNALNEGKQCHHNYRNIRFCLIMYFSYLVLFLHFFYSTYIVKKPSTRGQHDKQKVH